MAPRTRYCGIRSCENFSGTLNRERIFFQLPRNNDTVKNAWINEILKHQTKKHFSERMLVCDLHFREDQFTRGCKIKLAIDAVPTVFRDTNEMHSNLEPKIKSLEQFKSEPMDLKADIKPLIPRFTYTNRKRPNQSTKTLSIIPNVRNQTSPVEEQMPIKVEQPDECKKSLSYIDPIACIENHNHNQNQQTSQSNGCIRCINLKFKATQLAADTNEFQHKCQILRTENTRLRQKIQTYTSKALRLGQIICHKRCELCSSLVAAHQFREHLCTGLTEIACEYCANTTFTSTMALAEHLSSGVHARMEFYKCSECTLGFRMNALLKIHQNSNHIHSPSTTTDTLYKCTKCDESSEQPLALVRHFQKYHPSEPEPPKGPFFECYICKCQLDRHRTVRRHLKFHVAARATKCEICGKRFTSNELMEWHICGQDVKCSRIPCEYCNESFQSVAKCLQHLEIMHADDRTLYQCRKCTNSKCYGMKLLKILHEKNYLHPVKALRCDICSRTFVHKFQIQRHMEQHSNDASLRLPFLCAECGKRYRNERSLHIHQQIHTKATIQCTECPGKFYRHTFKAHYEMHKNLKYKCNECNVTCANRSSLGKHIRRLHKNKTEAKTSKCPYCDFKFARSSKLQTHLRTHTGEKPFECEFCHNFYKYKGDLMKHMQIHVGDNLYKCDVCGQGFRYHNELRRHSFIHYKEDKEKYEAAQKSSTAVENEK